MNGISLAKTQSRKERKEHEKMKISHSKLNGNISLGVLRAFAPLREGIGISLCGSLCLLCATLCNVVGDTTEASKYEYLFPVTVPQTAQTEELVQVLFTTELFASTRDDFTDIHVIDRDTGKAVPFLVEEVTREEQRTRRHAETVTWKPVPEASPSLVFVLSRTPAASPLPPLMGLTVQTPLTQFEQYVDVDVSSDGTEWIPVVRQARILDYNPFANYRMMDVFLPAIREQYLRLTFAQTYVQRLSQSTHIRTTTTPVETNRIERTFTEEQIPFRLTGIEGWTEETYWVQDVRPLRPRDIMVLDNSSFSELRRLFPKRTMLVPHTYRVPLEYLRLDSPAHILNVRYELYAQTVKGRDVSWVCVARGTLERTRFRDYLHENMTITWPPTRSVRYALVFVDDADDADTDAATLTIAEAKGGDYRIVFPYR